MTRRKSSFAATERILSLLRYLSEKPHSMSELRDRLAYDMEHKPDRVTVQNDLSRLKDWGFPLDVVDQKRVLTAPAFPVRLSDTTLEALRIALKLLENTGLSSSVAALTEITQMLPEAQRKELQMRTEVNLAPQVLINWSDHHSNISKLEQAIRGYQQVEFNYLAREQEQPIHHQIEPMSLDWKDGRLYVNGYRVGKNYELSLRIDRIVSDVQVLPFKFAPKPPRTYPISFRIWGRIAKDYQKRFFQEDEPIAAPCDRHPDALLINATITNYFWAKRRLLGYLPYVEIVKPAGLVKEFREVAEEMAQLYLNDTSFVGSIEATKEKSI
jgi:predicted DNA-binding transcriptional regulator YafY